MENKFTWFKVPLIKTQDDGLSIELTGWYDRGSRAVVRGYLYYNEDKLDYICGVDKSQVKGVPNV